MIFWFSIFFQNNPKCHRKKAAIFWKNSGLQGCHMFNFFRKKTVNLYTKIRNNPIEKPWNQSIYRPTFTNSVG
jgi:hypothetical protein